MAPSRFRPALRPAGLAAALAALALLFRSLAVRNAYEIVLSSALLGLWLILLAVGTWAARKLAGLEPGWKPPVPLTAASTEETLITGLGGPVPRFFRLHYRIQGRFYPEGSLESCGGSAETAVPRKENRARLSLSFPMAGLFRGEAGCRLRDIFGFFSFHCGLPQTRILHIRSAPCPGTSFKVNAQSGAEDRHAQNAPDEERYYMREYAPGDRFRDINWKSSDRIDTLITRISPDHQEKVSRVEVYFRNYGPAGLSPSGRPSPGELWLLDRAKARLARFLRTLMDERASYVFALHWAGGFREIQDEPGLESFLDELAVLPFSPPRNGEPDFAPAGKLYVFSTSCDAGLPAFLAARQGGSFVLFLVQPAGGETGSAAVQTFHLRDFPARNMTPPFRWLGARKPRRMGLPAGAIEIDYAEVRL
jgi:hypothetical protein